MLPRAQSCAYRWRCPAPMEAADLRAWRASQQPSPRRTRAADRSCHPPGKRGGDRLVVAEWQHLFADDLAGFMALAGNQQYVAPMQILDRATDRLAAVADFERARSRLEDRGTDRRGILTARIVVGHYDPVGELGGNRSHHRSLALVAIAAATEHHGQPALGVGPQRLERLGQCIGLVRVVDENRRAVVLPNKLEPAFGAFEIAERREGHGRIDAGGDHEPRCDQRIIDLELARQRKAHAVFTTGVLERERLCKALDRALDQANALAAPADGDEPQVAAYRRRRDDLGLLVIGRDYGGATRLDQIREQAQLGGKIGLQGRMIVEMITAKISESAGGNAHAVEAALIESMRGGFDGEVGHAFAGELIEGAVERHRVRCGERAVDFALWRDEPDGADARGRMAERRPYLA